jgi:hypothetical protein
MLPNLYIQSEIKSLNFLKKTDNIIYTGPELSTAEKSLLTATGAPVVFVQDIIAKLSKEVLEYNFPGVALPEAFSVDSINAQIRSELAFSADPTHYMVVHFVHGDFHVYDAETYLDKLVWYLRRLVDRPEPMEKVSPKAKRKLRVIWDKMSKFSGELYESVNDDIEQEPCQDEDAAKEETDDIRFSVRPSKPQVERCRKLSEPEIRFRVTSQQEPPQAHQTFSTEMAKAAAEIEKMVKDLLLQGFPAEIVQSWLNEAVKLSRLRITRQFKILLVDYDMEIKMGPLPKTVFLFYLRHPEGVKFTYLQDHVDELRNIYGHVSVNDDPVKMDESIASLTDPLNNSICEKCAAIKKAFMLKVHDNVARNYYITGMQGGEKGIALDRNLVEWECQL